MGSPPTPAGVRMQRTREELEELLHKSEEDLKNCSSANRKLKAVMTKVNKVIGPRKSVRRKAAK